MPNRTRLNAPADAVRYPNSAFPCPPCRGGGTGCVRVWSTWGGGGGEQAWIERVAEIPVDGSNQRPDVCLIEVSVA